MNKSHQNHVLSSFPCASLSYVGSPSPLICSADHSIEMQHDLIPTFGECGALTAFLNWSITWLKALPKLHQHSNFSTQCIRHFNASQLLLKTMPAKQIQPYSLLFKEPASRLLFLHPSHFPFEAFPLLPLAPSIAIQITAAERKAGADSQAKFRGGGKGWHASYTPVTTIHAGLAAKFPPLL